jgi:hypothetical protein
VPRKNRIVGKPYMQRHKFGFFVMWNKHKRKKCHGKFTTEYAAQRCIEQLIKEQEECQSSTGQLELSLGLLPPDSH